MAITHDYEVSRWGRGGDHVAEVRMCTWIEAMTVARKLVDAWPYDETDTGVLCDPNHPDDTHRDEGYA
jgi:hypothetical protein